MKRTFLVFVIFIVACFSVFSIDNKTQQIYFMNDITCSVIQITQFDTGDPSSRIESENLKERLLNNYNSSLLDTGARDLVEDICKAIDSSTAISRQKEQLDIVLNGQRAAAIKNAIPNPINLIGTISFTDPVKTLAGLIGTAASSAISYKSAIDSLNAQFNQEFFSLNEEEIENLNTMKLRLFKYNSEIGSGHKLTNEEGLSREELELYCSIISSTNPRIKRQELISKKDLYQYYPDYWLERAIAHHDCEEWADTISCIELFLNEYYESNIFRRNHKLASALINGVDALAHIYSSDKTTYKIQVVPYLELIEKNSALDDWESKYFCAMVYLTIADEGESNFLLKAYDLLIDNVRKLIDEQKNQIDNYLNQKDPRKEDYITTGGKNNEDAFEKAKNSYEKSLPPYNSALRTNFNVLWEIANNLEETHNSQARKVNQYFKEIVAYGLDSNAFFLFNEKKILADILDVSNTMVIADGVSTKIRKIPFSKDLEVILPLSMVDSVINNKIFYASERDMQWIELPIEGTSAASGAKETAQIIKIERNKESLDKSMIKIKIKKASNEKSFFNSKIYVTTIDPEMSKQYYEKKLNTTFEDIVVGTSVGLALGLASLPLAISTPVVCSVGGVIGGLYGFIVSLSASK